MYCSGVIKILQTHLNMLYVKHKSYYYITIYIRSKINNEIYFIQNKVSFHKWEDDWLKSRPLKGEALPLAKTKET